VRASSLWMNWMQLVTIRLQRHAKFTHGVCPFSPFRLNCERA